MSFTIEPLLHGVQVTAVDPGMDTALGMLEQFAAKAMNGDIDSNVLQHGAPWRDFPRNDNKVRRQRWAKIQMMDFLQAFSDTEFGVRCRNWSLNILCATLISGSIHALK